MNKIQLHLVSVNKNIAFVTVQNFNFTVLIRAYGREYESGFTPPLSQHKLE